MCLRIHTPLYILYHVVFTVLVWRELKAISDANMSVKVRSKLFSIAHRAIWHTGCVSAILIFNMLLGLSKSPLGFSGYFILIVTNLSLHVFINWTSWDISCANSGIRCPVWCSCGAETDSEHDAMPLTARPQSEDVAL